MTDKNRNDPRWRVGEEGLANVKLQHSDLDALAKFARDPRHAELEEVKQFLRELQARINAFLREP